MTTTPVSTEPRLNCPTPTKQHYPTLKRAARAANRLNDTIGAHPVKPYRCRCGRFCIGGDQRPERRR